MVGENPALQLVQVGGGKLHAAPGAVPVLIIAPLEIHTAHKVREEPGIFSFLVPVLILLSINFLSSSDACLDEWEEGKLRRKERRGDKKLSF